jgi:acetyl-CoA carboxylase biotin carboxyl carrier protein
MGENPPGPTKPLDVQTIHSLVRLMKRYDLTALDLSDGQVQVRLRRQVPQSAAPPAAAAQPQATASAVSHHAPSTSPVPSRTEPPPSETSASPKKVVIESPMVGTYYASSAPDAPPFVSVGSVVQPDTVVCIIEAMKVFTDIPAGVSGTIAEVLVKNGQAVEFGQPLFRVIPS